MAWFKLAGEGAFHAKVLAAGNEAYGAWCRAGQWSSAHLTEGFIPQAVAQAIAQATVWQTLSEARAGGEHGLVEPADGGWQIHDYLDWNPSAAAERAKREARSIAGKRGGLARVANQTLKQPGKQLLEQTGSKPEANREAKSKPVSVSVSVSEDQIPSVCVDPNPGSTARANPTSAHTGGGVTPESLMSDVRRYPSLCALAADEQAITDMAYAAAISGMPAEAASEAVAAFSIARAAEIPSMTPEALKRALGGFLARQRSGGNGRPKPEPMDPDVRQCVDDFRAAWSKANGGKPLPPASGDDRHAAEVVRLAKAAAGMPGVKASPRDVWRHVMRGYCGDGDHALSDQAHPLALLPSRFSRYGMPGLRAAAPKALDSASLPGPRKLPPGLAPGPGMTPEEIMRAAKAMK